MKNVQIKVQGMSCAACSARIENRLNLMPGVEEARVNLLAEQASVKYDPDIVQPGELVKQIEDLGYSVPLEKARFSINGMSCAACAARVEKVLQQIPGVEQANVNLATETALVEYRPAQVKQEDLVQAVSQAGYSAHPKKEVGEQESKEMWWRRRLLIFSAVFAAPFFVMLFGGLLGMQLPAWMHRPAFQLLLATPVQFIGGFMFYRGAFNSLKGGGANMDVLVSLGTSVAYFYSLAAVIWLPGAPLYFEASAMLITLILLGKYLEALAKGRSSEAIKQLIGLKPRTALVLRQGQEREIATDEVCRKDIVIIKPGQIIPVDGKVVEGYSAVNESMLTGEGIPVDKGPGDLVAGATINQFGVLKIEATQVGSNTVLAQIIRAVEEAEGSKAPIQRLADKVAGYFVPAILLVALGTFAAWYWVVAAGDLPRALINATAVLVIACPCAMGLATPTSIMVGTGMGAQNGILIRGGEPLERVHRLNTIVLDKTGTITNGRPELTDIIMAPHLTESQEDLLLAAAAVESLSEHPLAQAIVEGIRQRFPNITWIPPDSFLAHPGKGIEAHLEDKEILIGSGRYLQEKGVNIESLQAIQKELESAGKTLVFMALDRQLSLVFGVADTVKEQAKEAIRQLEKMGLEVWMITGDNYATARAIADQVGIKQVLAEVLPQEKANTVQRLKAEGRVVAMVGDGINDAPALAAADVGIAMGTGTDVAMEAADITIIRGDLHLIAAAINLSRATVRNIKQNLFWAFFYNTVSIPVAAAGLINPVVAGVAMSLSSISVVGNALRLKRIKLA